MTERKEIDGFWGWHIEQAIAEVIKRAAEGPMMTVFNGVTIHVDHDSNPDLLYRDWQRALSGYIPSPVGPHPAATLTPAELAHDAEVERQNQVHRDEADRAWREKQAVEKAEYEAAMATAPAMERDDVEWQKGVDAQKGDGYGLGVYGFAEAWARLMQAKMAEGKPIGEVADACCSLADKNYGITGFMYGAAVSVLSHCWKHGEELRRWHNIKTQIRDEGERANESGGVLNPALLNIGSAA
jgi:hypothetical protein